MKPFATVDIVLLATYFIVTAWIGFQRRNASPDDFVIGSRSLGLVTFVATLVATWYGGILAVGEYTYQMGLANWTTQGLPYYIFATVFALLLAGRVRLSGLVSIPDTLERAYGRPAALLGSLCALAMATPAPYMLMVGQLLGHAFGLGAGPALVLGTLVSVVYVYFGGFLADVRLNVMQFGLMFLGFALAVPVLIYRYGGVDWLQAHLPATHLRLDGGLDHGFIAVWFFIALWTLVDPGFHQRCYAAKSPRVAVWGVLIAVCCWALFDFLTTTTGLYARAALPNLAPERQVLAFPLLADAVLPPGIRGLFYISLLATVMSTVVSYTFLSSITLGRDVASRIHGHMGAVHARTATRGSLLIVVAIGLAVAYFVPSVVRQWYAIGTVFVPGMLIPVLMSYFERLTPTRATATACLACGPLVSGTCLLIGWTKHGIYAETSQFPFGLQPMYPGLIVCVAIYVFGQLVRGARLRNSGLEQRH